MAKKIKIGDRVLVKDFEVGDRVRANCTMLSSAARARICGKPHGLIDYGATATVMEVKGRQVKVRWDVDGSDFNWELNRFHHADCFYLGAKRFDCGENQTKNAFKIGDRVRLLRAGKEATATVIEAKGAKIKVSWDYHPDNGCFLSAMGFESVAPEMESQG